MQGAFSSSTLNVTGLLGRSSFPDYGPRRIVIPPSQREFSWEKSHVATFWSDMTSFHENYSKGGKIDSYFMGPIVIIPQEDKVLLLDGQQRMATTVTLLSVMRDIARKEGGQAGADFARDIQRDYLLVDDENNIFSLELGDLDKEYFLETIQIDPPKKDVKTKIRSQRLIKQTKEYFVDELENLYGKLNADDLVKEYKKLKRTITERIKLVVIEVASEDEAYLIFETLNDRGLRLSVPDLLLNYLMSKGNNQQEKRKIRSNWNKVIENLGPLKVSSFLRHMWVSKYGDVKSQGLYKEIKESLSRKNLSGLQFTQLCSDESENYSALVNGNSAVLNNATRDVAGIVNNLSTEKALPVLLSGLAVLDDSDFAKLANFVAGLVIQYTIVANLNPSTLEDQLYSAARVLREEKEKGEISSVCLRKAKDVLRSIIPSELQVLNAAKETFLTKKQAQYILYKLASYQQSASKVFEINESTTSIEHIFPEEAQDTNWSNIEELEPLVWHLGNLTALEPTINRDAGNIGFEQKLEFYKRSNISMTTDIIEKYRIWNKDHIESRAKKLVKSIRQVWVLQ